MPTSGRIPWDQQRRSSLAAIRGSRGRGDGEFPDYRSRAAPVSLQHPARTRRAVGSKGGSRDEQARHLDRAGALLGATEATGALAHRGGHAGGCADFRHLNPLIAEDPAAFGFRWARNLGDIVSWFASLDDGAPSACDIVENVDHRACG